MLHPELTNKIIEANRKFKYDINISISKIKHTGSILKEFSIVNITKEDKWISSYEAIEEELENSLGMALLWIFNNMYNQSLKEITEDYELIKSELNLYKKAYNQIWNQLNED